MKRETSSWYGQLWVFLLLTFHAVGNPAGAATLPVDGPAAGGTYASSSVVSEHSGRALTGKESLWGVAGRPSGEVLKLVNASPLLKSALNAYQDAVDNRSAVPFGVLQEDWSGAKVNMLPTRERQLVLSSDVLAESPQDFVGDLSHGLGYFWNYDRDKRLYNNWMPPRGEGPLARTIVGGVGVWMESHAEVYNFLAQQEILAAAHATKRNAIAIKLANNDRSNGLLQVALDNQFAADKRRGLPANEIQERLDNLAYILTGTITVPKRSATPSTPASQVAISQNDIPTLAAVGSPSEDRDTVVNDFLVRLKNVADSGALNDVDKTMKLLGMGYSQKTTEMTPSPPDCSIDWHPKSTLKTDVQRTGNDWYQPTQFGVLNLAVPGSFVNPSEIVKGEPTMNYAVTHTVRCTDKFRLQDSTEAKLDLYRLPPYACVTVPDIARVFPGARPQYATDGYLPYSYEGHLDEDTGTFVTFSFRRGEGCALGISVEQSQESGMRFRRAVYKFQSCWAETQVDYCAGLSQSERGQPRSGEMSQYILSRCPTMNALYLKEPLTGELPPKSPLGINDANVCR
ncbi:hypothetical protein NDK50_33215 [Paraburkholderia bryophila]|uniref:hypothetical protein n=1 Tax=Paraburkholderia bryophila TaxID=420952 RepID=UPI00234919BE|nr:hypothetical protein [Paraburkholderia bryophila]WCM22840.1 hypothetical protein NDK50_33215 [Paraburkholderia bryophila]